MTYPEYFALAGAIGEGVTGIGYGHTTVLGLAAGVLNAYDSLTYTRMRGAALRSHSRLWGIERLDFIAIGTI
ncbi:MAG TPA: hypothetical protein VN924_16610 [Bryobacteraceae bacterium]|nr:hypothetical protein [Bryobacteraceae bacterium]